MTGREVGESVLDASCVGSHAEELEDLQRLAQISGALVAAICSDEAFADAFEGERLVVALVELLMHSQGPTVEHEGSWPVAGGCGEGGVMIKRPRLITAVAKVTKHPERTIEGIGRVAVLPPSDSARPPY